MSGLSCIVPACDSAGNQFAASARRLQTWSESATVIDTRISHTPRGSVALSDPGRETLHVAHVVLSLDVGGLERGLINQIREGLKLDSVDLLSVMLRVETQLGISLDSRDFEKVTTVGDLLDVLEAKLAARAQSKAA